MATTLKSFIDRGVAAAMDGNITGRVRIVHEALLNRRSARRGAQSASKSRREGLRRADRRVDDHRAHRLSFGAERAVHLGDRGRAGWSHSRGDDDEPAWYGGDPEGHRGSDPERRVHGRRRAGISAGRGRSGDSEMADAKRLREQLVRQVDHWTGAAQRLGRLEDLAARTLGTAGRVSRRLAAPPSGPRCRPDGAARHPASQRARGG